MRTTTFAASQAISSRLRPLAASAVVAFACIGLPAIAGTEDVMILLKKGQTTQALDRVDRDLVSSPNDRKLRFLKGVALAELNRLDEATVIFLQLTQEAPELPEPYNNLAVIYAQQKQYDKAKAALEMAIRTHPSYSVAHENLGDLYTKLARQAYDRALQLDAANTSTQAKLGLIREIISVGVKPSPAPTAKPAAVAISPTVNAAPPPAAKPAPTPVAAAPAPVAAAKPTPATTPAAEPSKIAANNDEDDIRKAVQSWASAWAAKNVSQYLSFYAPDFKTPGGAKRSAWEKERNSRIDKPGAIKVGLANMRVSVDGNTATVRFRQSYQSNNLDTSTNKTLMMVRNGKRWQIQQERTGN